MFVCAAMAEPRPMFVFHFNEDRIVSNSSKYTLISNNTHGTLTVLNLHSSDDGTYTCTAYNRFGSVVTSAVLSVQGMFGYVQCNHKVSSNNINGICRYPSNLYSFPCSLILSLCFLVPPTLIFFPSAVRDVVKNETLIASCRANANPPPLIQWFQGAQILGSGDPSKVLVSHNIAGKTASSQLTITGFTSEDEGAYACVAVNSLGNDSRSFQINAVGESATNHGWLSFKPRMHDEFILALPNDCLISKGCS